MKIIFLDINGVLNHERFYEMRQLKLNDAATREHPFNEIDADCVANLNWLIQGSGAKVVISSTWRHGRNAAWFSDFLKEFNFKGEIIDVTPSLKSENYIFRGNEIYEWLNRNKDLLGCEQWRFRDYVILDDDSDMLFWQRNNFLLVDRSVGLTKGLAYRAFRILYP